jgi:hypothetical protein
MSFARGLSTNLSQFARETSKATAIIKAVKWHDALSDMATYANDKQLAAINMLIEAVKFSIQILSSAEANEPKVT